MLARLLVSAALVSALTAPAFAADSSAKSPNPASQTAPQTTQNIPTQIRSKLQQEGFTNVSVVPGSFLVSAKAKNGDPVTMVIGPNSMMMMTQVPNSSSSSNSTTGAATNKSTSK